MNLRPRWLLAAVLVLAATTAAACGGSNHSSARSGASAIVLMAHSPSTLDPAVADTPEALEADWLAYTPLLTYVHASGPRGTQLVPGLAQTLPSISGGGLTYAFTLIKGLKYSNGKPVRASDFLLAAERAVRLWPEASRLITDRIAGARAFAERRSKTIAGIATDDAGGHITIRLTAPYGAFENVLALPVLAPVPAGTPMTDQGWAPPAGLGPYRIVDAALGRHFSLRRTPNWQRLGVTTVPGGRLDVEVRITGDAAGNARSVLSDAADVFDSSDQIPASLIGALKQRAAGRYAQQVSGATTLVLLNTKLEPFESQVARQAVREALDQPTLARIAAGMLRAGCDLLPPTLFGHAGSACPRGNAARGGNLTGAEALVRRSGMAGTRVTVWSDPGSPARQWMAYFTTVLDEIGFRAVLREGAGARDPQAAFLALGRIPPNPAYYYDQLSRGASLGRMIDSYVDSTVRSLAAVPGSTVSGVARFWRQLEQYVGARAYFAVLGYPTAPELVSSRIDFDAVVFSPLAGVDWSSLRLK